MNFFIILQGEKSKEFDRVSGNCSSRTNGQKEKNETEKFLFNLKFDLGEKNNLYENNPEIVNKLSKRMIQA